MVAVFLPKAGVVFICELNAAQPFGAFPKIKMGENASERIAVLGR